MIVWSVASFVILLAGIGALAWYYATQKHSEANETFPETDPLSDQPVFKPKINQVSAKAPSAKIESAIIRSHTNRWTMLRDMNAVKRAYHMPCSTLLFFEPAHIFCENK